MSEEQATSQTPEGSAQPSAPVRRGMSPFGALLAMIIGAIIGAGLYYAVDEREDRMFVADVTNYFSGTLQDTGPMMGKVLESLNAHNYGEAKSGLEEILTVWQRASQVKGMEEHWTLMDDLINGLAIAAEKVGQVAEDSMSAVQNVVNTMRQMGINVPETPAAQPAPPPPAPPAPGMGQAAPAPAAPTPAPEAPAPSPAPASPPAPPAPQAPAPAASPASR